MEPPQREMFDNVSRTADARAMFLNTLPENKGKIISIKRNMPYPQDTSITRDEAIKKYGLPTFVTGNPLPCSCHEAYLSLVSKVQADGWIYADYRCSADWSNIFRFKIDRDEKPEADKVSLSNDNAYKPTDLETF